MLIRRRLLGQRFSAILDSAHCICVSTELTSGAVLSVVCMHLPPSLSAEARRSACLLAAGSRPRPPCGIRARRWWCVLASRLPPVPSLVPRGTPRGQPVPRSAQPPGGSAAAPRREVLGSVAVEPPAGGVVDVPPVARLAASLSAARGPARPHSPRPPRPLGWRAACPPPLGWSSPGGVPAPAARGRREADLRRPERRQAAGSECVAWPLPVGDRYLAGVPVPVPAWRPDQPRCRAGGQECAGARLGPRERGHSVRGLREGAAARPELALGGGVRLASAGGGAAGAGPHRSAIPLRRGGLRG